MGTVVTCLYNRELLVMFAVYTISVFGLAIVGFAQQTDHLKALQKRQASVPVTPGNIAGLVPGSAAAAEWWAAQIVHAGHLAHHVGKRQASVPVTPGNIAGLVPGSPAAAEWWAAQIAHAGQLAHHVGKRQASVPVTPGNIAGLVPGSAAAAEWWAAQIA